MKHYVYLFLGLFLITAGCKRNKFEEIKLPLAIKTFWPNSGKAGTIVTFNGTGFGSTAKDNEVSFNGVAATVVDVRDTMLVVLAPEKGTSGIVAISTGGKKIEAGKYTYQNLSMRGVSPLNGPAGTNISISGEGFSSLSSPAKVMVNGKEAVITSVNDTLLIATVPVGAGSGIIKVLVDDKEVTGPGFTFQDISKIKPLKGGKGSQVTITGEGFSTVAAENSIAFNGKPGTVISATGTQLVVATPDDVATGPLSVTVKGQKTVGPVFTVIPPPVLLTVAPLSSPAGQDVTIAGENFSKEADENEVSFNGVKGVVKSASEKELVITIPVGAGAGNMKVWVNGQETAGPLFKEQNLGITKLSPDNGLAGTEIVITGIGFSTNPGDNQVNFNGVMATVLSATATELKVKAPAGVSTGILKVKVNTLEATGPTFKRAGVMTLAGGPGTNIFTAPRGIAVDRSENVYILDNNQVKKITPAGTISTYAGSSSGAGGHRDGAAANALFKEPKTIVIDRQDNLYVMDFEYVSQRSYIRKITPSGDVSTILALNVILPGGIAVDKNGVIYIGKNYEAVFRMEPNGSLTKLPSGYQTIPNEMAVDDAGNIYYTSGDYYAPAITKVATDLTYATLAGSRTEPGFRDGQGIDARIGSPEGAAIDPVTGNIMFIDGMNQAVRMVTPGGLVTTLTGAGGTYDSFRPGYKDGTLKDAFFSGMKGLCVDKDGNIYVMDVNNSAIRKIFLK